ncbi:cobalamin-dependent protein [bacterium]|nr:cobalamin-dependent protein [bacterium]
MQTEVSQELKRLIDKMNISLRPVILDKQFEIAPYTKGTNSERRREASLQDIGYNLSYLAQAIELNSPNLFVSYSNWLKGLMLDLGFSITSVIENFRAMKIVMLDNFPVDYHTIISEYIEIGIKELGQDFIPDESYIDPAKPYSKHALDFLAYALGGKRHEASQLILSLVKNGVPIKTIYLEILQKVQYEVGHLWHTNKISIAQEHYITSLIQLVISQLYPFILNNKPNNKTLISACISGELHEIGLRMLSDIFELEGWDTWFLGANLPDQEIISMIKDKKPDVLALSVTMTFHLDKLTKLIQKIRDAGISTPIMVGGYPFNNDRTLWKKVGADGWAMDPDHALKFAARLTELAG